jgi:nitrogen regulatory protein PII
VIKTDILKLLYRNSENFSMKRIDAMVPSMRRAEVVHRILKAGAQGVTVVESRGKGNGERPMVEGARGTARYIADYNRIDTITLS